MNKQPSVAQMFEYVPGAVDLVGFPRSRVLERLSTSLGQEVSLRRYRTEVGGRKMVMPSFPVAYTEQRQEFFRKLPPGSIGKSLFERQFPRRERIYQSVSRFLEFCDNVYDTIAGAKEELVDFDLPEARSVLERLDKFDSELNATLARLKDIRNFDKFAIDANTGIIVNIDQMPPINPAYIPDKSDGGDYDIPDRIQVKMKKAVLDMVRGGRREFKTRIVKFVRDEFGFDPDVDNIRSYFERLAVPVRLNNKYRPLLEECKELNDDFRDRAGESIDREIPASVYPQFGRHYDIKDLFPPSLLKDHGVSEFVPIDFTTKDSERKFLLAGLHSGGKSFFLENLVLTSVLGQLGEPMPAGSLLLPRYDRIFYFRNAENGGNGAGKLDTEINAINGIINKSGPNDLLVFDEFLDSTTTGVATWLGPELLSRLDKKKATVFVSTHRNVDYTALEQNGWTLMSPEHVIERGRVVPTHKIKRGLPDEGINRRYVRERFKNVFRSG